jgi:nucleoside phosphorylase/predicted MPP superfamily phosphohydrolase
MDQKFILLHISDLHIRNDEQERFDRSVVLDPLLKRVQEDVKKGLKPGIIVVTGDVAYQGIQAEYELAQKFLDDLLGAAALSSREKMFIVPGNHDVNRKMYRPRDIPSYKNMQELNEELGNNDYRKDLLKGMKDYFQFIHHDYPHLQPIKTDLIPFLLPYTTAAGKNIGLIGLNSAWMCRKSPDEKEIAIGEFQIKTAAQELEKLGPTDLDIYLLHHPLSYLWPEDASICRSYFKGEKSLLLSGHLHQPGGMMGEDLQGRLMHFQAGGAYLGSSEATWPASFHYITIDWAQNALRLDFRAYDKSTRKWHVDARTGEDGTKKLPLFPHATKKSRGSGRRTAGVGQLQSEPQSLVQEAPVAEEKFDKSGHLGSHTPEFAPNDQGRHKHLSQDSDSAHSLSQSRSSIHQTDFDVLIVLVNEIEKECILRVAAEKTGHQPSIIPGNTLTYLWLGMFGGVRIGAIQCNMGSSLPGSALTAIMESINEKNPEYIILCGVAFGMDPEKQKIGDILLSKQVALYEPAKLKKQQVTIRRGDIVTVPEKLFGKFNALSGFPFWSEVSVHIGLILSGEKLIDDPTFKAALTKEYQEAIGGEMEAAGAYSASRLRNRNWIVVKGVCDYADGNKSEDKTNRQRLAATNAAKFLFYVLENGKFGVVPPCAQETSKPPEQNKAQTEEKNENTKKLVKENIFPLLEHQDFKKVCDILMKRIKTKNPGRIMLNSANLADILIDMLPNEAVSHINLSIWEYFKNVHQQREHVLKVWEIATELVGWIVILAVRETAVNVMDDIFGGFKRLIIPVKTKVGVEVVFSHSLRQQARLNVDESDHTIKSEVALDQFGMWESGDKNDDNCETIKQELAKILLAGQEWISPKDRDAAINQVLGDKEERNEHYYIPAYFSMKNCLFHSEAVYQKLKTDIPHLKVIFIDTQKEGMIMIVSEGALVGSLVEFFRNKP